MLVHQARGNDRYRILIYDKPYRWWKLDDPVAAFEAIVPSVVMGEILARAGPWCEVKSSRRS
jgi:hypothetical protein